MADMNEAVVMTYALQCRGRLVPRNGVGIEYQVEYELHIRDGSLRRDESGAFRATCSKFLVHSADSQPISDADYNLRSGDGRTHHIQQINGRWRYLGTADAR